MPDHEELREQIESIVFGYTQRPEIVGMVTDALLPVVERYAAQRAAEALRERTHVVRQWAGLCDPGPFRDGLLAAAPPDPQHRHDRTEAGG